MGRAIFFYLTFLLIFSGFEARGNGVLLGQRPQWYPVYGAFRTDSTCSGLENKVRNQLLRMTQQGHKVALIANSGSSFPVDNHRLRDDFGGLIYFGQSRYLEALEDYVMEKGRLSLNVAQNEVRNCVQGKHRKNRWLTESCVDPRPVTFLHMGIVVLDPSIHGKPFVVHFYGDENYDYLKPSIRVENLDSYIDESNNGNCDSNVISIKPKAQERLLSFLKQDHAQKLLTPGNRSYNLLTNPWGLTTQNCNKWMVNVLASSLFINPRNWSGVSLRQSRQTLIDTGYRPTKVLLKTWQNIGSIPASLVPGIKGTEGNINHRYGVADILPADSVLEWLERHRVIIKQTYLHGQL